MWSITPLSKIQELKEEQKNILTNVLLC